MKAYLILEDGTVFEGRRIGADRDVVCEVVFNTAMAGYLEVLTDPSYAGQGVAMTYPLMGNYGINEEDAESRRPWASAFIVQSVARRASNYRSEEELDRYLSRYDIPGIAGLDTRALTRHLRTRGTMNGMITSREDLSIQACSKIARDYRVTGVVKMVSRTEMEHIPGEGKRVAHDEHGMGRYILATAAESETGREISITEVDIDSFIRAKAAIFSAINIMLSSLDMDVTVLSHVYVAGGIGSGINMENAVRIGMLPDIDRELFEYLGNTSLSGAYAMARSDCAVDKVDELASNMTYLELSTNPRYMDEFVAACFLPHTNRELFPSSIQE